MCVLTKRIVLMTDPAVAYVEGYEPFDRGVDMDIWLKLPNGSYSLGLVWPGRRLRKPRQGFD